MSLLHNAGLIDEFILAYIPVILGEGIELFPSIKKQENLKLTRHQVYENGVALFYFSKA
ncbi:dihydrofolate reductase family protein [Adhaeribacter soli]|uniref:dihydrofolate reductase family protein n=1 Tax=Adhaeribacter soli TaxID=2607655 RepID=UPI0021CE9316|nr:dihydrofolate reductase family protein [Adhaeribacter soli]